MNDQPVQNSSTPDGNTADGPFITTKTVEGIRMSERVNQTTNPSGNFYELCFLLGQATARLADKEWVMSGGAQLAVLHHLAASLGLRDAVEILRPLMEERINQSGDCYPDHWEHHHA